MHIFFERLSFTPEAVIGVGLIFVYFTWMMWMAIKRIRQGHHMDH